MTKRLELYKCNVCGNIVEVIAEGAGELICCSQPMEKLVTQKNDAQWHEKHVPYFTTSENGEEIRIGSVLHPMEEGHYIQFVETISKDKSYTQLKFFNPGEMPVLVVDNPEFVKDARAYCNLHGLWSKEK